MLLTLCSTLLLTVQLSRVHAMPLLYENSFPAIRQQLQDWVKITYAEIFFPPQSRILIHPTFVETRNRMTQPILTSNIALWLTCTTTTPTPSTTCFHPLTSLPPLPQPYAQLVGLHIADRLHVQSVLFVKLSRRWPLFLGLSIGNGGGWVERLIQFMGLRGVV